ncbi:MAG: hypothetical protein ACRD0K_15015 [Egibacteraceae bacterium]
MPECVENRGLAGTTGGEQHEAARTVDEFGNWPRLGFRLDPPPVIGGQVEEPVSIQRSCPIHGQEMAVQRWAGGLGGQRRHRPLAVSGR